MNFVIAILLFFSIPFLEGSSMRALYYSLDPYSVAEALAFYELYPQSEEGKKAMERVRKLIKAGDRAQLERLSCLINRVKEEKETFTESDLILIEDLASHLGNRRLKGYGAKNEAEIIALLSEEIDLGSALILSQLEGEEEAIFQSQCYSAMLDLMALQILARLSPQASLLEKICETNRYIFEQMHFRFPPQSVYAENIDLYTFLPSVMDNHLGVCLGVTALYLAIAQRIDLPLEIITPPGHIYVRCLIDKERVNIETTARGVHVPDESYLSLENGKLPIRTLKEVIGMTHVNQASIYLYQGEYAKAAQAYKKALPYMPDDPLVKELLGYSYLFMGKTDLGEGLLKEIGETTHSMGKDYLAQRVDLEGMEAVLMLVDETRESLLNKQKRLEKIVEKFPEFKEGFDQLAVTWIQLNRAREAIQALLHSYKLDCHDPTVAYYLAVLYAERHDYKNSWHYLVKAEEMVKTEERFPKALRELRRELILLCPENTQTSSAERE